MDLQVANRMSPALALRPPAGGVGGRDGPFRTDGHKRYQNRARAVKRILFFRVMSQKMGVEFAGPSLDGERVILWGGGFMGFYGDRPLCISRPLRRERREAKNSDAPAAPC